MDICSLNQFSQIVDILSINHLFSIRHNRYNSRNIKNINIQNSLTWGILILFSFKRIILEIISEYTLNSRENIFMSSRRREVGMEML